MVLKAEVGRFDGDYKIVAFNDGDKVRIKHIDKAQWEVEKL